MLLQLSAEDIANNLEVVLSMFSAAQPPQAIGENYVTGITASLLSGITSCYWEVDQEAKKCYFQLTVHVEVDACTRCRVLFISSLYGLRMIRKERWIEAYKTLKGVAKKNRCTRMAAFTTDERVIKIVESIGGDASFRLITAEVPE